MLSQEDINFIEHVEPEAINWSRLSTPYGRANDLPDYLSAIADGDISLMEQVMELIEHQGTLWQSTPFALIFMTRIFSKTTDEECISALTNAFLNITEACREQFDNFTLPRPLESIIELLDDDNLMQEFDNEEDEEEADEEYWEEGGYSDELFSSFFVYSYEIIMLQHKKIEALTSSSDEELAETASKLAELLMNTEINYE